MAVIDSGVDAAQPQLAGAVTGGPDLVPGPGRSTTDCSGHGTMVAGIIAARPARGTGVVGIAPGAHILSIAQSTPARPGTATTLAKAILAAVAARVSVINISAVATASTPALTRAVDAAEAANIVVVAAAGNLAERGNPITYPAAYPGVLAVGAVDQSGTRAPYSETGSYLGVVAPGVNIIGLGSGGRGDAEWQGTSFATPIVSAEAALIRADDPSLGARGVVHRIESTAHHASGGYNRQVGWGAVDPVAAVTVGLPRDAAQAATGVPAGLLPAQAGTSAASPPARRDLALEVALAAIVAVALVAGAALTLPRGRVRRWRPAGASLATVSDPGGGPGPALGEAPAGPPARPPAEPSPGPTPGPSPGPSSGLPSGQPPPALPRSTAGPG